MNKDKKIVLIITFIAFLFFILFSYAAIKRHVNYLSDFDLALAANTLWNTTYNEYSGSTMNLYFSGYQGNNYLGLHFSPVLFLILPFFAIWPRPETLLIFQNIVLVLGIIPLYLIAKHFKLNSKIIIALVLYYLCFPGLIAAVLCDYHPITFFPLFFLSSFYFYLKKHFVPFTLFIIITLLIKENISLFIAFLGSFLFFNRKEKKLGIVLFISGIIIFFSLIGFIIPSIGTGSYLFQAFYPEATQISEKLISLNDLSDIIGNLVIRTILPFCKWSVVIFYFLLAFPGVLLAKFGILLFVAPFLQKILAINQNYWVIDHFHYNIVFLPLSIIVIVFGYIRLKRKVAQNKSEHLFTWIPWLSIIFPFLFVLSCFIFLSLPEFRYYSFYSRPDKIYYDELLENVPERSESIACSGFTEILPHLYNRKKVYIFPLVADAEYIILINDHEEYFFELTEFIKNSPYYKTKKKKKKGFIIKRVKPIDEKLEKSLYELCKNNSVYEKSLTLEAMNCQY